MPDSDSISLSMNSSQWAMLLFLSFIWGGSFFFIEVLVDDLPVLVIVTLRVAIAAVLLNIILLLNGTQLPMKWPVWKVFIVIGVFNNTVPFVLITWGQVHIASGLASILNATTPLFTLVIAHYLTHDEKFTANRIAGLILGFAGVIVLLGVDIMEGTNVKLFAQLAVLAAAFCYALAGVLGRRFEKLGVKPIQAATGQLTVSSMLLFPAVMIIDYPFVLPQPQLDIILSVLALAVLSTAVAYIVYFRLLSTAGATNLLLVTYLIPVTAILLGTIFLGERLHAQHFAGMALIGLGLAVTDGRLLNRFF